MVETQYVRWLEKLTNDDVAIVGGKNASLGEMITNLREEGVRVPGGFATTAEAYRAFIAHNDLQWEIRGLLGQLEKDEKSLSEVGRAIRRAIRSGKFTEKISKQIRDSYADLSRRYETQDVAVAVRSSATAEDLPEASFAGQQETYLNVRGADDLLEACRDCYASLFTDRAISYRRENKFDHMEVALSVAVQKMVRADRAGAGVMFSLDTDTGFPGVVVISAAWGLGETVVQGSVTPDEYRVFKTALDNERYRPIIQKTLGAKEKKIVYSKGGKSTTKTVEASHKEKKSFVLSDDEILELARWARAIEQHYDKPMDMEWAKDGDSQKLYCVQARPETVQSQKKAQTLETYSLKEKGDIILTGVAIGQSVATGKAKLLDSPDRTDQFEDGDILVTGRTDPDWGPIMKRASAIVTDHGGRTSHAAIVSRELGIPAVVGTDDATQRLRDGQEVTVSCVEGDSGRVYEGALEFEREDIDLDALPDSPVRLMINIASPAGSMRWWRLPVDGIGLARMEFIINDLIKVHPMALLRYDELKDKDVKNQIDELTRGYEDRSAYFVEHLARGIASIAAPQYPAPAVVRMSDFKTNEYADLVGGKGFEPHEENPMIGFRGASRYYSDRYRDGFALECKAIKMAREEIGLDNIVIMLPFVRTLEEADKVLKVMEDNGLGRGQNDLLVYMMCEVPSNVFLAEEFAERFDGFSIGSNDLTQLILGVGRDSEELSGLFDERNEAVKSAIRTVIERAHKKDCKVSICGQAPSDYPDFARFLASSGIDTISLNPDSVVNVIRTLSKTV